jgi:hypothetical protein
MNPSAAAVPQPRERAVGTGGLLGGELERMKPALTSRIAPDERTVRRRKTASNDAAVGETL